MCCVPVLLLLAITDDLLLEQHPKIDIKQASKWIKLTNPRTRYANDDFIILDHLKIMNRFITINFVEWYFVLKHKF